MHMSWVLSFNLKYFYKQINNENCIKIKIKKNVVQTLQNKIVTPIHIYNR